jgi:hypothetical protein
MGTTNTGGGTTTSFSNAPQAGDDLLLAAATGLTEDSTGIVYLNVMANDAGGNAKTLWSLDNDISASTATKIYAPVDLLTQDTARTEALSTDTSRYGAKIWITSDGKVGYDPNTLAFQTHFQSLAAGEIGTDTFTYAIRLGNGTLSWATATVQIKGNDDAPVVDLNGSSAGTGNTTFFTEDGSAVAIAPSATLSDVDDVNLESMKVTLTNRPDGSAEILSVDTSGLTATQQALAATASYSTGTGELIITGTATKADYEAVLRAVKYSNSDQDPDTADRTVTVTVNDGDTNSVAVTATVHVDAVNDAPVNTVPVGPVTGNEDSDIAIPGLSVGDVDAGSSAITVTLSVLHGALTVDATVSGGLSAADIAGNGTSSVTLTGTIATIDATLAALNAVVYRGDTNFNGSDTLTMVSNDQGHTGSGGSLSDTDTVAITVNSVNDAPSGADKTVSTNEDTAHTFGTSDFGFSDPNDSPANGLAAVKITSLPGAGTLLLNGSAVAAGDLVSATEIAAGHLTFAPAADANGAGYASFTFQVQDDGGTANGGVDLDPTANTITVDVTSVNDAPSGADKTVTTNEDTAHTFGTSDFGFSDPNDSPANGLAAVKITSLPGAGQLLLNGSAVAAGDLVSATEIAAGLLTFARAADANGAGYASFTFQGQDDGGTANGGVDLDPSANTITVDVTSVNDAPSGADKTVTSNHHTAHPYAA